MPSRGRTGGCSWGLGALSAFRSFTLYDNVGLCPMFEVVCRARTFESITSLHITSVEIFYLDSERSDYENLKEERLRTLGNDVR